MKAAMTASPCLSKTSASQVKVSINWSINWQAPPRDNFIKRGSQRPLPRAAGPTWFALRADAGLLTAHVRLILGNAEAREKREIARGTACRLNLRPIGAFAAPGGLPAIPIGA